MISASHICCCQKTKRFYHEFRYRQPGGEPTCLQCLRCEECGTGLGTVVEGQTPTEFPNPTPHKMVIKIKGTRIFYQCTDCNTAEDLPGKESDRIWNMKVGDVRFREATLEI